MATSIAAELREIATRVRREHRGLEATLEALEAGCARLRLGAIPKHDLEGAIYDLYVKIDEHIAEEERLLRPLVPRLESDAAARLLLMFEEHDEQRSLLLSVLDSTEQGALAGEELITLVSRVIAALRADLSLEEELLTDLRAS